MELGYERRFKRWAAEAGCGWSPRRYSSPTGDGEARALHLTPPGIARALILVVHGAGNDALFGFVGTFKALLRAGYEVFSFDLAGHGRESTTVFGPAAAASAVEEAMEQSGAAARKLPVHAVGVSLGGSILLASLRRLSPAPLSATIFCAPLKVEMSATAVRGELGLALLRTVWREREHFGLTGLIPSFGPFNRTTYPLRLAEVAGPGSFGYVDSLNAALASLKIEEAARDTQVPVLLVYGGRDRLVPVEQGERIASALPHSELQVFPEESHLSVPLAPAALRRWMSWLEEHSEPRPHEGLDAAPIRPRPTAS